MKIGKQFKRMYRNFKCIVKGDSLTEFNKLIKFLGLEDVSYNALSEATYYSCLKVLSEAVGKLPLKLLQYTDAHGVIPRRDNWLYHVVGERPNPYMTATAFWSTVEYNRNHHGNAYCLIHGAADKLTLWILPPDEVDVYYDNAMILADVPDIYYLYSHGGKYYRFGSEEILHIRSFDSNDGIIGISVKDRLKATIKGNQDAQDMLNKMYKSGFTAKAVIQYTGDMNEDKTRRFLKNIEKYASGELSEEGIKNIIPIPVGSDLKAINTQLADNQFIEIKQYSALQIASAFGIKPYQIGDYTKSSYASAEAQQLSFYIDTLLYILKQYEEELSYKLLSQEEQLQGLHFKFNVAAILRADHKTQIETLSKAVANFIYTPNEAREFVDKEALPGGDRLLGNGATIPVEMTGLQYSSNSTDSEEDSKKGVEIESCVKIMSQVMMEVLKNQNQTKKSTEPFPNLQK